MYGLIAILATLASPSPRHVERIASSVAVNADTELPVSLILAIIESESDYNPTTVSRVGCIGLMQLSPSTAREVATSIGLRWFELKNIENNITLGVAYLRALYSLYGQWDMALTAYNQGPRYFSSHGRKINAYARRIMNRRLVIESMLSSITIIDYLKSLH